MPDGKRALRVALLAGLLVVVATEAGGAQASRYHVGRPLRASDVQAGDHAVAPDGTGLPTGHGTVAQGAAVYRSTCASCHGDRGQGIGEYPALVGGQGTLTGKAPLQTVGSYWPYATTVWDYIHRAMPYQRPGSLSDSDVYAVTAYILYLNRIVPANADLSDRNLPKVRMPNRDGFIADPRPDVKPPGDRRSIPPPGTDSSRRRAAHRRGAAS